MSSSHGVELSYSYRGLTLWVILTNIRLITLRGVIVSLLLLVLVAALACGIGGPTEEELRDEVVAALDALAADLAKDRPIDEAA